MTNKIIHFLSALYQKNKEILLALLKKYKTKIYVLIYAVVVGWMNLKTIFHFSMVGTK
jgi:hypothetical protein